LFKAIRVRGDFDGMLADGELGNMLKLRSGNIV
jgi:hypothetical protein